MIIVLLCGGAGTRFDNIYPKPLNLVNGIPMIYHVIKTLKVDKFKIIFHQDLEVYGFKQYLINNFRDVQFDFIPIHFQTRGPAETVYLGLRDIKETNEQVLILDNDNIYKGLDIDNLPKGNFVFYKKNLTGLLHYSFVKLDERDNISQIEERKPISNHICVGGYGFESVKVCLEYCKKTIHETISEPYMSYVCKNLLDDNHQITGYHLPECFSIGTPNDIIKNRDNLPKIPLRIVFDLDNTLVTYPNEYKKYDTVQRIEFMVNFLKEMKRDGHYIIINTARNMVTSGHNEGKCLKNIGLTTLQSLNDLGIEYDEIHFGKPYGDLYIDDKAFNTFDLSLFSQMGFYSYTLRDSLKTFNNNRYNRLIRINKNHIIKFGDDLSGEIFFYNKISNNPVSRFFPKIINYDSDKSITMEFINGTNLNKLYSEGLLPVSLFQKFLQNVKDFHLSKIEDNVTITGDDISNHYLQKFEKRSQCREHYPFQDFKEVYNKIKNNTLEYLQKEHQINSIIHGDLWFSNITFYKNDFIFFDMRGKIDEKYTIKGHTDYDYAKIYQSILGLDHIIEYDEYIPENIKQPIEEVFWEYYRGNVQDLKKLTGYLLYNTFHAYDADFQNSKKQKIWSLIKNII